MSEMNYVLGPNGNFISEDELYHYGVLGMKWGRRKDRNNYRSTNIKSALARRSNNKVDEGFKNWNENTKKRQDAVELGKRANAAKRAYENDPKNKEAHAAYRQANKEYKKALSSNTTYRKGVVRQEVGRDAARKYLSDAKKVKKQLAADPSNKALQKKYGDLMSKHDVERAKARRATDVAAKRSKKKASIKRTMTKTAKAAATATAVAAGTYAVNRYLGSHDVTLNGNPVRFNRQTVSNVVKMANKAKNFMGYVY